MKFSELTSGDKFIVVISIDMPQEVPLYMKTSDVNSMAPLAFNSTIVTTGVPIRIPPNQEVIKIIS